MQVQAHLRQLTEESCQLDAFHHQTLLEGQQDEEHQANKHDDAGNEQVGVELLQVGKGCQRGADKQVGHRPQAFIQVKGSHTPSVLVAAYTQEQTHVTATYLGQSATAPIQQTMLVLVLYARGLKLQWV